MSVANDLEGMAFGIAAVGTGALIAGVMAARASAQDYTMADALARIDFLTQLCEELHWEAEAARLENAMLRDALAASQDGPEPRSN